MIEAEVSASAVQDKPEMFACTVQRQHGVRTVLARLSRKVHVRVIERAFGHSDVFRSRCWYRTNT
jgi:hypothetical protein